MPTETLERRALERGQRVAAARRRAGFSQQALAEKIGAGRQSIARIEAGTQMPGVEIALALAAAVNEPVEVLFGRGER